MVQFFGMRRSSSRLFDGQQLLPYERRERLFKRERPAGPRDRDFLMQMLERVLANVLPSAVTDHEQLGGRDAASADTWKENLRHDRR